MCEINVEPIQNRSRSKTILEISIHGGTLDAIAKAFLTLLLAYQSEHRRETQVASECSALACSKVEATARPAEESCAKLEPLIEKVDQLVEGQ